jgi:hypothetical protein
MAAFSCVQSSWSYVPTRELGVLNGHPLILREKKRKFLGKGFPPL